MAVCVLSFIEREEAAHLGNTIPMSACVYFSTSTFETTDQFYEIWGERYATEQWRTQEFCSGGGSTNPVEDRGQRERGSGGGSPLVRGSGVSCNLVQEISFHIVKFS
jgi:hypothetical protein